MKKIHFLSGIPRSGSTVLAAILNQNPMTHVSTTSGLIQGLDGLANTWSSTPLLDKNDLERDKLAKAMRGIILEVYSEIEKPVIIDKSRGWPIPIIMHSMKKVLGEKPKIVATVRSIPDCMASFIRVARPQNLDDFIYEGQLSDHLRAAYQSLKFGFEYDKECFCIVEYEDLISNPKKELERIHEFLSLPSFSYDFDNIDGTLVQEDDENLHGYKGMHDIKPSLKRLHTENAKDVLKHHYASFCQPEFWLDTPRTSAPITDLDVQHKLAITGHFEDAWEFCKKIEKEEPHNYRASYNRGWFYLRQGQIQKGYQLMDTGRIIGVFGNKLKNVVTLPWDGVSKGTVMLYLEGGLGDQIHQIRYAKNIADKGCKVIVSCAGQLVRLLSKVEGVSAIVPHEASINVYHDFHVKGMSAVLPLGFELHDLSGKPYIQKPISIKGSKKRIGLRWQGQSMFEHEHHKKFPYELMFDAVKGIDADFISLQRDEGSESRPPWVREVDLETWENTRDAIASCDLVISSCTSVSHLSAAMGVSTWVVIPVMGYFLYAMDGETCPYYDSMRLFRQKEFGDWSKPFEEVRTALLNS